MFSTGINFRPTAEVEINTRGCCFICLKQVTSSKCEAYTDNSNNVGTSQISDLFYYLKLSLENFVSVERELDSHASNITERLPVTVELCKNCKKLTERISKLICVKQTAEMEIGYQLGFIHERIFESGRTPSKMNYYRVMTKGDGDNRRCSLLEVDGIRKKLSTKCSKENLKAQPKVLVNKISPELEQFAQLRSTICNSEKIVASRMDSFPSVEILALEIKTEMDPSSDPLAPLSPEVPSLSEMESTPVPEIESIAESSLRCKICMGIYSDLPSLNNHMGQVHGIKRLECLYCKRVFPPISKLYKQHVRKCSTSNSYKRGPKRSSKQCLICSKAYSNANILAMHYRRAHPHVNHQTNINLREHKCNICGKIFFRQTHLRNHKTSVHFGARFKCNFPGCSNEYKSEEALVLHWKRKHGTEPNCDICFKKVSSLPSLMQHLKTHMDQVHPTKTQLFNCKVER